MKKSVTLLALILSVGFAQAQFGKLLKKDNIKAGTKAAKAVSISDEDVMKLSKEAIVWMDENNPIDTGKYGKRLEKLVAKHLKEDGLNLNFKAYRVVDINAFATADGSVRVMAGLMDLMSDDELLAVIGHEIGHVKHKHSKKQMKKAYMVSAGKDALAANTKGGRIMKAANMSKLVENLANAQFSQGDEKESDKYGFNFMVKYGYDYHAVATAFQKLADLSKDGGKGSLMSSHPGAAKRAKKATKRAKKQDKKK